MRKHLLISGLLLLNFFSTPKYEQKFDTPKSVTYASRDVGITHLIKKAEKDAPEMALMYLPEKNVWINVTIYGDNNSAVVDVNTIDSLLKTNNTAELWHQHNDKDIVISEDKPLYWITPSPKDLSQLFYFEQTNLNIKSGIANIYGSLLFWTEDTCMNNYPGVFIKGLIDDEASNLQYSFGDSKDLTQTAKDYRGIVWTEWKDR